MNLKLKVCGMRESVNILELSKLKIDYIGFIFYSKSKRFVDGRLNVETLSELPKNLKKIGVFVDEDLDYVKLQIQKFDLNGVQLHGNESPEYCQSLRNLNLEIIKAFSLDENFEFNELNEYQNNVDFFLFDTKGKEHGGNGVSFDWSMLSKYTIDKPYFLAGGIDLQHINDIVNLNDNKLYAVDINSKFEIEPGLKNITKIKQFKAQIDILNKV